LLQLLNLRNLSGHLLPLDLIFKEQLLFSYFRPVERIDLCDPGALIVRQFERGRLLLQAFHSELVSRFHLGQKPFFPVLSSLHARQLPKIFQVCRLLIKLLQEMDKIIVIDRLPDDRIQAIDSIVVGGVVE